MAPTPHSPQESAMQAFEALLLFHNDHFVLGPALLLLAQQQLSRRRLMHCCCCKEEAARFTPALCQEMHLLVLCMLPNVLLHFMQAFDVLLLLQRGGIMLYFGPLKEKHLLVLCLLPDILWGSMQAFDALLLLQRGGSTLYCGPLGENARDLISYFENLGVDRFVPGYNAATWMLENTSALVEEKRDVSYAQSFQESSLRK